MNPQTDLDVERTIQATERTFLAYLRTGLNTFAIGVTFIKFFDLAIISIIGWLLLPVSLFIIGIGFRHYKEIMNHLKNKYKNSIFFQG